MQNKEYQLTKNKKQNKKGREIEEKRNIKQNRENECNLMKCSYLPTQEQNFTSSKREKSEAFGKLIVRKFY